MGGGGDGPEQAAGKALCSSPGTRDDGYRWVTSACHAFKKNLRPEEGNRLAHYHRVQDRTGLGVMGIWTEEGPASSAARVRVWANTC